MATRQISLTSLFAFTTVAATTIWLAVSWWQLLLLICVSVLPATVLFWIMSKMRRNSERRIVSAKTGVWLVVLSVLFFILYFLSAGPAMYVDVTYLSARPGDSTPWWLARFYEPLQIFDSPSNPLRNTMGQYFDAWAEYCGIMRAGTS